MVCKLDFEKAYEMVDCNFLQYMLTRMGFGAKWRKWIHCCISSSHFSILVNGSPKGYFKSSRGLRQGDPLSPMLFDIVAKALHALLEKAKHKNLVKGFAVENANIEVTHLQFADDTILFCGASLDHLQNLRCILKCFEFLSSLKINYDKCELIGVRTESSHIAFLANVFGCKVGKLPSKYLGIPLCLGFPKKHLWDSVVERI